MQLLLRNKILQLLRWSERYTKTDMVYVAGGSFWIILGRIGVLTISFVTMMAFARWFPKEMYGTYQFVLAGIDIASIFALSGLNTTLIRSIARNSEGALITVIKKKMKWSW